MSFMLSGSSTLFKVGNRHFQMRHLLVIGILCIAFTTAFIMRSFPIKYGFYLNEFDPYFDYRATKYIVDNGLDAYWKWHDTLSWYPEGRDVPKTSQSGLHIAAAYLYKAFGGNTSLLDFTILLPVILGSLTTIVVFALVRTLSGTTAGLFSALLFAFSPAIIQRGNLGWFKSEPLGLFFALLATYLFVSSFKNRPAIAIAKAVAGGLILGLANASWGGVQYFSIPISLFFIAVTFFRKDLTIPLIVAITFTVATLLSAGAFPRPGLSFVVGLPGISLIGGTIFLAISFMIRRFTGDETFARNNLIALGAFAVIGIAIISSGVFHTASFRYLNAINPFLSSQNPLVESVAEHFTPTLVDYFTDYGVLLMFAGFGAWMAIKRRNDTSIFALLLGITGVYVSATFARLLVFASIGIIVLAGIGLYEVTRSVLAYRATRSATGSKTKRKFEREGSVQIATPIRVVYIVLIILLISLPILDNSGIIIPPNSNWISSADIPPSIANGGTGYRLTTNDWINALNWISTNTPNVPKSSVIAAWWDYGYWITTLGNRTSLADNATINQTRIATIAKMFMDQTENGLKVAKDLKADYILVYVVGQRFSGINGTDFYVLGSGGDESKKQWFIRIGGFEENRYLEQDGFTPTPFFWNKTLLGGLIPFSPQSYASFSKGALTNLSPEYQPGTVALYSKDIKYPANGDGNKPLKLVYASDSFNSHRPGLFFAVLIYQVNPNYIPKPTSDPYHEKITSVNGSSFSQTSSTGSQANTTASKEMARIDTAQGPIMVEFFPYAAPNHVANFEKLAKSGFYDGTIFHRIVKGFVIQGGDNNTKPGGKPREFWGTGGPGNSVAAEFNDIPHKRGIVSMARSSDPNSAGSQFFIVLNDSRFLDRQYTVFGNVTEGMDVVDKIANLPTVQNDQPRDPDAARIKSITILDRVNVTNMTR
jgi:dolichyl-diphosphooligosaccharide---protein glycosyltransferase